MNRGDMLDRAARREPWDFVVIGGGATGAGIAVDAATRGYSVLLLERATSARARRAAAPSSSTAACATCGQGTRRLVLEALHERGRLRRNAPHLVHDLAFVVPATRWWRRPFYGARA